MDYRTYLPTWISILLFFVIILSSMLSGLFTNVKKAVYFAGTSLLIWLIGYGIGFGLQNIVSTWIGSLLPSGLIPIDIDKADMIELIQPYALFAMQWIFIILMLIPQALLWHFVFKKMFKLDKKAKTKNKKTKVKEQKTNWKLQISSMFLVPVLGLPGTMQVAGITLSITTTKDIFEEKASAFEKGFASFLRCDKMLSSTPGNALQGDLDAILGAYKLQTDQIDGKPVFEYYTDFFPSLIDEFTSSSGMTDFITPMKNLVAKINKWKEVNTNYLRYIDNIFGSKTISKIMVNELIKQMGEIDPIAIKDKFNNIVKISNCLINGFSIADAGGDLKSEPLDNFSFGISHEMYSAIEKVLMSKIFNSKYDADESKCKSDCNQFVNYFFRDKAAVIPAPTKAKIETLFDISKELPTDITGTGTKLDPYAINLFYFGPTVDRTIFYYQLVTVVSPAFAKQKIEWSYELTTPTGQKFADNHWISTPETNSYFGDPLFKFDGTTPTATPDGQVWGITSTASIRIDDKTIAIAEHELFWTYFNRTTESN